MRTKIAVMGAVVAALASLGMLSPREGVCASKTSQPDTRYVVFHKPGPKWVPGVDFRNPPGVEEHVAHYKRLFEVLGLKLGKPHQEDPFICEELAVECGPAELTFFVRAPRTIIDSYHSGCGW